MNEMPKSESELTEVEKYLTSGPQTEITPEIEKLTSDITGTVLEKTRKIFNLGESIMRVEDFDENVFRKRTASEIIKSKYVTGCTDAALAFLVIARATGIPAKYVETIDTEWLRRGDDKYSGHIYVRIFDNSKDDWILIDPMKRKIDMSVPKDRVIYKEGLDSWDIGIKDFETLKKAFDSFRDKWLVSNSE
ncbi:MAG: transglutaminase domain-containing protein [Candidatus Dojkabacteria bacterium]|jgi:hypothetical protein